MLLHGCRLATLIVAIKSYWCEYFIYWIVMSLFQMPRRFAYLLNQSRSWSIHLLCKYDIDSICYYTGSSTELWQKSEVERWLNRMEDSHRLGKPCSSASDSQMQGFLWVKLIENPGPCQKMLLGLGGKKAFIFPLMKNFPSLWTSSITPASPSTSFFSRRVSCAQWLPAIHWPVIVVSMLGLISGLSFDTRRQTGEKYIEWVT